MKLKQLFSAASMALVMTFSIPHAAQAAFPAEINGKELPSLAPMLKNVIQGVVNIATESKKEVNQQANPFLDDPIFKHFFNMPEQRQEQQHTQSLGSGVIVDAKEGFIVTNNHVIAKADKITVTLRSGKQLTAKVIGAIHWEALRLWLKRVPVHDHPNKKAHAAQRST